MYEDKTFDFILCSYNGLISIPKKENRNKALRKIYRILKRNGMGILIIGIQEFLLNKDSLDL